MTGQVRDSGGLAVSGASIIARTPSGTEQRTVSGPDGRFTISLGAPFELTVLAGGFAPKKQSVRGAAPPQMEIVLELAPVAETVTVTPTRSEQRLGDVPASVNVLTHDEIRQSPGVVADDVLRQIPTFSLFRRANSVSAHPTTQGVSLRGIGPSGVSRTLVLLDGVPFNDPFGGWVYWTRVPLEAADRIEVVDNSSSSLYGNYAMGGVINILTTKPSKRTVEFKSEYGNRSTPKVDFRASDVWGKLGVSVDGSAFDTDGYPNVVPSERRTTDQTPPGVDNNVAVTFKNFDVKADYAASDRVQIFGRVGYFHENRDNGKASTIDHTEEANNTTWKTGSAGVRVQLPDQSTLVASLFTDNERFHSNFLAVPNVTPLRSLGRVSLNQDVPTKDVGGMVQWSRAFIRNQVFSAGADWRWVEGESQELAMDTVRGQTPVTSRFSGGDQRLVGAFVQDIITPLRKLELTLSARVDRWRNYNGHNLETTIATGLPTPNNKPALADRVDTAASPRAAALYHFTDRVSAWGDFGYGFRAPTLNELYRQFSVGAITTKANDQLGPERLKSGEIGVSVAPVRNLTARATWFDNRVKNPVSNVSLNQAGTLLQRQNLGRTRITGIQTDVEYRLGPSWRFAAGYLYNEAKVVEFAAKPELANNCPGPAAVGVTGEACHLPQVPKNRGSLRVTYANPKYATVALAVQVVGSQFDDDQNKFVVPAAALADAGYPTSASTATNPGLPKFTLVDLTASRAIGHHLDVFLAAQNLANREYFVGTLPTLLGPPRLITAGVRVHFQGR